MNDDTDKLAAELRKLQPSKKSRKAGMKAAMAAFDAEFASESVQEIKASVEKISTSTQGLADAPRPTGQTTGQAIVLGTVQSLGSRTMKTLNKIINMSPRTAMLGGSCMAALIASFVVYQAVPFDQYKPPVSEPVIVVENAPDITVEPKITERPVVETPVTPAPADTPTATIETPVVTPAAKPPVEAVTAVPVKPVPVKTTEASPELPSNVVTIERRVLKTPASTQERVIPSVGKQVTRRVIDRPASTQERIVPAITKQVERRIKAEDGTLKTVTETVVVKPQSVDYITMPATYRTVTETVVVQEASTQLVTIPPVYETVRETVKIGADGSTQVLKSETISAPKMAESKGGINSVSSLLAKVRSDAETTKAENDARVMAFRSRNTSGAAMLADSESKDAIIVTGSRITRDAYEGYTGSPPAVAPPISSPITTTTKPRATTRTVERVIPAVTKQVTRRVIKTPASSQERVIPAITKEVTVRVKSEDGTFTNVTKTFVIQEARTEFLTVPPVYETVTETVVVQAPSTELVVVDVNGNVISRMLNVNPPASKPSRDKFENYESNPITLAVETPVSTFSIDVDTASYSFLRASLNRGQLPPPGAIRLEEMINYFPYDYTAPKSADEPFKANVTVTPTPWNKDTKLMHIGIKGYVPPADEKPSSNIVFLIDTSGSMRSADKLPLLINSFKLLLDTLDEDDTVSIVTYAGSAGTVLEPTPASEKAEIKAALNRLNAGGSTAGAAGLELAYQKAAESFDDEAVNRVILATDGDFNVGFSSPDEMKTFIKKKRETGIFLSVLGFGNGNYNDQLMQTLAQNGNGVAAYIDTLAEANKVLANEAGSALITIAKDVKIQVEFNPETISEYRLIGYETRALKREDFNNDKVDAGDIGAGHSVTAIYELTPVGSKSQSVDDLRYVSSDIKTTGSDEYAFVKIRHKLPNADTSTLQTFPIGPKQERSLRRSTDDMRFAAAVAAVGQKLRGETHLADFSYDDAIKLASRAKGDDEKGYRTEFVELVRKIKDLQE